MTPVLRAIAAAALACTASFAHAQVTASIDSRVTTPTLVGTFAAGSYTLTATNIIDLIGDGTFMVGPDGRPDTPVTAAGYGYFNPDGAYHDYGSFGPAGPLVKLGAIAIAPSPTGSWQQLFPNGRTASWTIGSATTLYAMVNDTFYANNAGAFDLTVTAVPEPGQAAMLLVGLGVVGWTAARRRPAR